MGNIALEIVIILALILLNGFLALAEIAIVSARKARLQQRADQGDAGSRAALQLAEEPNEFLSTVQIGITLVGVLAGAYGGATISEQLAIWLAQMPWLGSYSEAVSVLIVVLVITYLSLILGELVPKRLALNNPEQVASSVGLIMKNLARIFSPVIRLMTLSTDVVLNLLRAHPADDPPVTEDEIKVMIQAGTLAGVFREDEQEMVGRIFRLADWRVGTLITPRPEITWIDLEDDIETSLEKIKGSDHAIFPVAKGGIDNVQGLLRSRDLMVASLDGLPLDLNALMVEPLLVPESMLALQVLEKFKDTRMHMALVIDEFGGLQGLVTLNDILEAIVGEIPQRDEPGGSEIVLREDGSWLVDGMLSIDEFKDHFQIVSLPDEKTADFQTVGGFVMTFLGHIPKVSENFLWGGYQFEVMDMDGLRVDKIMVRMNPLGGSK